METHKDLFTQAIHSIFAPSTPLCNQDTIDYNNTIDFKTINLNHTNNDFDKYDKSGNTTIKSTPRFPLKQQSDVYKNDVNDIDGGIQDRYKKSVAWGTNQFKDRTRSSDITLSPPPIINKSVYNRIDSNKVFNRDYLSSRNDRYDRHTRYDKFDKAKDIDIKETRTGLPRDYPGKFPSPFKPKYAEVEEEKKYDDILPKSKDSFQSGRESRYTRRKRNDNKDLIDSITRQRIEHEQLLKKTQEINNKFNYVETDELDEVIDRIENNNEYLKKIIDEVENEKTKYKPELKDEQISIYKYNQLRNEYITELKNCEKFYDDYYKLVQKYRSLKNNHKDLQISTLPSISKVSDILNDKDKTILKTLEIKNFELRDENYELKNMKSKLDIELNKMILKFDELNRSKKSDIEFDTKLKLNKLENENLVLREENYKLRENYEDEVLGYKRKILELETRLKLN